MSLNKTKIIWRNPKEDWELDFTLNPVVGCRHACPYCYAERLNDRFKWIPKWTEPVFYPERLDEISKIKKPATIFVGSMSDIFGEWVDRKWILDIFLVAFKNPQHRFMFLTKNPKRYNEFAFPDNCWLGTTLDHIKYKKRIEQLKIGAKRQTENNKTFVSIEPILSDVSEVDFTGIDLLIVGADSSMGAKSPNPEWITSLKHD
ncbi:hypothetical protein LCGC14_2216820, partial [marine sediment metagenome]